MRFLRKKLRITRRDTLIAIISAISTLILQPSIFTINKYIEAKWFRDKRQEFTLTDSISYFPIAVGNTWVYSGVVEGQTVGSEGKTVARSFDDYTLSVNNIIDKEEMRIAVIGINYSLPDFLEDEREKEQELWIFVGGKLFVVRDKDRIDIYLKALQETNTSLEDFREHDLEWDFPLFVGKKYNILNSLVDSGKKYSYHISEKQKISISGITDDNECFRREFITLPDESYSWFCPGVGIVEEGYTHHGTVLNINYKLKEYFVKR